MKHIHSFAKLAVVAFAAVLWSGTAYADLAAWRIYDQFNQLNNNEGYRFTAESLYGNPGDGEIRLTTETGYENANTVSYAYPYGGTSYFSTFCVEPNIPMSSYGLAKLNYDGSVSVTSEGNYLTVGAAYLYKMFATGELAGYTTAESNQLTEAIHVLMGLKTISSWFTNKYLRDLIILAFNEPDPQGYWVEAYNPGAYYSYIGDYSIFVMTVTNTDGTGNHQDFLYISEVTSTPPPNDTPEPATLLLWSLGGLGVAGASWKRKRQLRKSGMSS